MVLRGAAEVPAGAPGPRAPAAVQTLRWLVEPLAFLDACARAHGDAFTLQLAGVGRVLVVSDAASLREVFTAPAGHLEPGPASAVFRPFVGDRSLLLLEGAEHLRTRRVVQPALHGRHVRGLAAVAVRAVDEITAGWRVGTSLRALELARDVGLRVTVEGILGVREPSRRARAVELARLLLHSGLTTLAFVPPLRRDLGPWSPWGRFRRLREELEAILREAIAERRRAEPGAIDDVLAALVAGRDPAGRGLDDDAIVDQLMTLLFAGHDTTSTSLAWAWNRVLLDPAIEARLIEEAEALADPVGADATSAPFVDAVGQETLRLHPPVPLVLRAVRAPIAIAGFMLEPGSFVAAGVHLAHRRSDTYPEPDRFRPARFLERSFSPYEHLPFGGGVRRCVGLHLALVLLRVTLVAVARRAGLRLARPRLEETVRRAGTLVPRHGCPIVVASLRR